MQNYCYNFQFIVVRYTYSTHARCTQNVNEKNELKEIVGTSSGAQAPATASNLFYLCIAPFKCILIFTWRQTGIYAPHRILVSRIWLICSKHTRTRKKRDLFRYGIVRLKQIRKRISCKVARRRTIFVLQKCLININVCCGINSFCHRHASTTAISISIEQTLYHFVYGWLRLCVHRTRIVQGNMVGVWLWPQWRKQMHDKVCHRHN